jgi:hypothetical protein
MNRQGGIDKKSIDSVDETIDSKGTIAKTRAGIDALRENQLWNINTPIRKRGSEAKTVPLHRASRHVGIDVNKDV